MISTSFASSSMLSKSSLTGTKRALDIDAKVSKLTSVPFSIL